MTNQRGWKDGVYNPGFPPDKAYMERKAKEWAAAGFEWPEIKGVQFKRTKNQHKPMRNVVTRVVMVGFDPFNHSGLPAHIEDRVVLDFWANEEQQFILDWVNDAPEGEIRFGGHLNLYGDEHSYMPFPEVDMSVIRDGFQWDETEFELDSVNRQIAETLGLPEELMKPTLRIPSFTNEVSYNGVKLSQLEIPEELELTRQLVIELTKEVAVSDHPNLLTLFVARGGNIRDLTEFFALLKVAGEKEQVLEESFERDLRGMRDLQRLQQLADTTIHLDPAIDRNSVRGIFPLMVLEQTGPDLTGVESDNPIFRNSLCPEVQTHDGEFTTVDRDTHKVLGVDPGSEPSFSISLTSPYGKGAEGEFLPKVTGAYAVGADGVKRDLRDIDFMSVLLGSPEPAPIEGEAQVLPEGAVLTTEYGTRPNPLREHWEKHGDPYEGRIPHIAQFADIASGMTQSGRNETMAILMEPITIPDTIEDGPTPITEALYEQLKAEGCVLPDGNVDLSKVTCESEPEVLTPEDIADREQAIQEASEGKLDYLLEGTQWDPKLRK